jgi:hypothetical protein
MTWVRYDDNVASHPKVEPLDDATYRLWREAIEWCARGLTDGVILARQLTLTSIRASAVRSRKLVDAGLWHLAGTPCDSKRCPPSGPDGWVIHDYFDYQPTRRKVREEQEAAAERKRTWLERKKNGGKNGVPDSVPNDTGNGVGNPHPIPSRPAPKGREGTDVPSAPPAAVGGVAAAGGGAKTKPTRHCPTCGNAMNSAYHANICARSVA